jgi:hypothetical protein
MDPNKISIEITPGDTKKEPYFMIKDREVEFDRRFQV